MLERDDQGQRDTDDGEQCAKAVTGSTRKWWNGVVQGDRSTLPESLEEPLLRAGFLDDPASRQTIRENLDATAPRLRVLALRAASRRHLLDADDWLRSLGDESLDVRREAIALLAYVAVDDLRVIVAMTGALDDADALVVDAAAFALGEHAVTNAVEPLTRVARDHDDARCREAAIAALGVIGDERGRAAIIAALSDKAPVRRRAVVALANFEGPDVQAALEQAGEDRDWQVRAAAEQLNRDDEGND